MRNLHKFLGIIAIGALVMGSLSCLTVGSSSSSTVSPVESAVDPVLLAKWYTTESAAKDGGDRGLAYEFRADGTYLDKGAVVEGVTCTTADGRLIGTYTEAGKEGKEKGSVTYVIEGKTVRFSDSKGMGGTFRTGLYYKN